MTDKEKLDKKLITIDGDSGSGKTTQDLLLKGRINEAIREFLIFQRWYYLPRYPDRYRYTSLLTGDTMRICNFDEAEIRKIWRKSSPEHYADYKPALSFWLKVPYHICRERKARRERKFYEYKEWWSEYDEKTEEYLEKLKEWAPNFYIIDGLQSIDVVHETMLNILEKHFPGSLHFQDPPERYKANWIKR